MTSDKLQQGKVLEQKIKVAKDHLERALKVKKNLNESYLMKVNIEGYFKNEKDPRGYEPGSSKKLDLDLSFDKTWIGYCIDQEVAFRSFTLMKLETEFETL
jgi:hypothetical protein